MKKAIIATGLALSFLFPTITKAQETIPTTIEQPSLVDIIQEVPIDTQKRRWNNMAAALCESEWKREYPHVWETYTEHIARFPQKVQAEINFMRTEHRSSFYWSARRADFLSHDFDDWYASLNLDEQTRENIEGVPDEIMKALIMAETWTRTYEISSASAKGIFQFMWGTWTHYRENSTQKRFDPKAGYNGHVKYMSDSLNRFDDVLKAVASYNAGPNKRILNRSQGQSYWEIENKLPGETRKYVPRIIAIVELLTNPQHYGVDPKELYDAFFETREVKKITLNVPVHPTAIADALGEDIRNLWNLNVRKDDDKIRDKDAWYYPGETVVLPVAIEQRFDKYFDRTTGKFTPRGYVANICADARNNLKDSSRETPYETVSGDSLSLIAKKFSKINDCRYTSWMLREYNDIKNPNLIRKGQTIIIPPCGWYD